MKKTVLSFFLVVLSFALFAQIAITPNPVPKFGCPNTVHNVIIGITNNTAVAIPSGSPYSVTITIKDNATPTPNVLATSTQVISDGIAIGATKNIIVPSVPFGAAMTCAVEASVTYSIYPTFTAPAGTYVVQAAPSPIAIQENPAGRLGATLALDSYGVNFYKDGDYGTVAYYSALGLYDPTISGSYTAKAYDPNSTCISATASNAVVMSIAASTTKNSNAINVSVYPNPMANSVSITTGLSTPLTYELADINGAVVRTASFTTAANVNVENLKSGAYVLSVRDLEGNSTSYKLVK